MVSTLGIGSRGMTEVGKLFGDRALPPAFQMLVFRPGPH